MPTFNLTINVTDNQLAKLQRWFPRWNSSLKQPYTSIEEAFVDILRRNIKNFVEAENLLKLDRLPQAMRSADEGTQDQVLDLLAPWLD